MRNIYTKILMLAMTVMAVASCDKSTFDEGSQQGAILTVEQPSTRVSFEDEGESGITPSWEELDRFTLYDGDGNIVDQFDCTSIDGKAQFESSDSTTELTPGAAYTAIYPASNEVTLEAAKAAINPSTQSCSSINDLDNYLYMLADFNYSAESNVIEFEHQMAIMTFKFKSVAAPLLLTFYNGKDDYQVGNINELQPDDSGIYTAHIMIRPCDATTRTLRFEVVDSNYDQEVRTTTSSKAYEVGKRYTATLSDYTDLLFNGLGDGSYGNPYIICSAAHLHELSNRVNGNNGKEVNSFENQYLKVAKDINLGGEASPFTTIGTSYSKSFKGYFDGGEHTISGLYVNGTSDYLGLFGYVEYAEVKDLTIEGSVTGGSGCHFAAGFAAYADGSTFTNCYNDVAVIANDIARIGGIVGDSFRCSITGCHNRATINLKNSDPNLGDVGGIVGRSEGRSTIANCSNNVKIYGAKDAKIGGVVGCNLTSTVTNCYNRGALKGNDSDYVGGVVGLNDNKSTVANCYNVIVNNGSAEDSIFCSGSSCYVGGVVGLNNYESKVVNCYSSSALYCSSEKVGGILGENDPDCTVLNSYFNNDIYTGNVVGSGSVDDSCMPMSEDDMKVGDFVTTLNSGADVYNQSNPTFSACTWEAVADDFPTLTFSNND